MMMMMMMISIGENRWLFLINPKQIIHNQIINLVATIPIGRNHLLFLIKINVPENLPENVPV